MPINKQPIFTVSPILYNNIYDPDIFDFLNPSIGTYFYATTTTTLIDRITVQIPANATRPDWSSKSIYLILFDTNTALYSIYQREEITGGTYVAGTNLPSVIWNFEGGLILPDGIRVAVQASTNRSNTSEAGDLLSVTIEGGTYE